MSLESGPAEIHHPSESIPPGLYLVASPIGHSRDITLRAIDVISGGEILVAEDTRTLRRLMQIHSIPLLGRKLLAYHDHNGATQRPKIVKFLKEGRSVAYISDAGTPLIADPGFKLVREAIGLGISVNAVPGPSAAITALCASGLATDRFLFGGFLPPERRTRKRTLKDLQLVPATLVFFESPKRLSRALDDISLVFGRDRPVAVCREMTKKFEEIRRGTASDLAQEFGKETTKGEIVIVVGKGSPNRVDIAEVRNGLCELMKRMSLKDAVVEMTEMHNLPRKDVYRIALELRGTADLDNKD